MRPHHIKPGMKVIILTGTINEEVNDQPPVACMADVISENPDGSWWLNVYMGPVAPGFHPLPQMYQPDEILGVPAMGLIVQDWQRD